MLSVVVASGMEQHGARNAYEMECEREEWTSRTLPG